MSFLPCVACVAYCAGTQRGHHYQFSEFGAWTWIMPSSALWMKSAPYLLLLLRLPCINSSYSVFWYNLRCLTKSAVLPKYLIVLFIVMSFCCAPVDRIQMHLGWPNLTINLEIYPRTEVFGNGCIDTSVLICTPLLIDFTGRWECWWVLLLESWYRNT